MFTGIIEATGSVQALERKGQDARLLVDAGALDLNDVKPGDSIAVSGVCLTLVSHAGPLLGFDVSAETLSRTTLGSLHVGGRVNLEKALLPTTRLGGHLVSGHVDGVGVIIAHEPAGTSVRCGIEAPKALARYIAEKGSICIEGVSLTVNSVQGPVFSVNLVPHTQAVTTLNDWCAGTRVNLEVDLLARYLERLLTEGARTGREGAVTRELLAQYGFLK